MVRPVFPILIFLLPAVAATRPLRSGLLVEAQLRFRRKRGRPVGTI